MAPAGLMARGRVNVEPGGSNVINVAALAPACNCKPKARSTTTANFQSLGLTKSGRNKDTAGIAVQKDWMSPLHGLPSKAPRPAGKTLAKMRALRLLLLCMKKPLPKLK